MKVNLKDIQSRLVKRGRDAFQDPDLENDLLALNPDDEDDAFPKMRSTNRTKTRCVVVSSQWQRNTHSKCPLSGLPKVNVL
jgi:hypothetical protein